MDSNLRGTTKGASGRCQKSMTKQQSHGPHMFLTLFPNTNDSARTVAEKVEKPLMTSMSLRSREGERQSRDSASQVRAGR